MYVKSHMWRHHHYAIIPQRMMNPQMVERVQRIAREKAWSKNDAMTILFVQGYGRKSLNAIFE